MAYISQEEKKIIAPQIKELLKQYGLKGSLSIDNHSTIVLKIKSGSIDFIGEYNQHISNKGGDRHLVRSNCMVINSYWFHTQFQGKTLEFLTAAFGALKGKGWYDESDSMTDYFHVKHYVSIKVGSWDKAYELN